MATPKILSTDFFSQWITKLNAVATEVDASNGRTGDLSQITLDAPNRATVVAAVNKVIVDLTSAFNSTSSAIGTLASLSTTSKTSLVSAVNEVAGWIGSLASLSTTAKATIVASINEVVSSVGTLASLSTTSKTSLVSAVNEVDAKQIQSAPVFTIGTETANKIDVSVQLKNKAGTNLASITTIQFYLSDVATGATLAAAPSGGVASGAAGNTSIISGVYGIGITNATGLLTMSITEATAKTFYLVLIRSQDEIIVSNAITFV